MAIFVDADSFVTIFLSSSATQPNPNMMLPPSNKAT